MPFLCWRSGDDDCHLCGSSLGQGDIWFYITYISIIAIGFIETFPTCRKGVAQVLINDMRMFYFIFTKLTYSTLLLSSLLRSLFGEKIYLLVTSYTSTHRRKQKGHLRNARSKTHIIYTHIIEVRLTMSVELKYIAGHLSSVWGQTPCGFLWVIPISCKMYGHHYFLNYHNEIVIVSIQLCIYLRIKGTRFIKCFHVTEINSYTVIF